MATFSFTCGRLLWSRARYVLESLKFKGLDITWIESPGWVERKFIVKGNAETLTKVSDVLKRIFKE